MNAFFVLVIYSCYISKCYFIISSLCSGHRIGTAEVESALVFHPQCAEAAVVGVEHEVTLCVCVCALLHVRERERE